MMRVYILEDVLEGTGFQCFEEYRSSFMVTKVTDQFPDLLISKTTSFVFLFSAKPFPVGTGATG